MWKKTEGIIKANKSKEVIKGLIIDDFNNSIDDLKTITGSLETIGILERAIAKIKKDYIKPPKGILLNNLSKGAIV